VLKNKWCPEPVREVGNRDLSDYTSTDGAKFRDFLLGKGLAVSSIKRIFSSLGPIIKLMIQEHELSVISPLVGTYMPSGGKKDKRQPIPIPTIKRIQSVCMDINDDLRWVIALVSDTGMRLAEVCGLERNDVVLDAPTPHITLQPNSARRLKTDSSDRGVPLVALHYGQLLRRLNCLVGQMSGIYFLGIPRVENVMLTQPVLL
jgi:integrase